MALARITLSLIFFSLLSFGCSVVTLLVWPVAGNRYGLLMAVGVLSGLVFLLSCLLFFSRGGAAAHATYMKILSLVLYLSSLVILYVVGLVIYSLATRSKPEPHSRPAMIALVSGLTVAAVGSIFATLRFPRLRGFVSEFRNYPRSQKVRLWEFVGEVSQDPEEPRVDAAV